MAITVECSNCGRRYNVDDSIAGKTVKCRQCGTLMPVPRSPSEGLDPDVDLSALSALADSPMSDEQAAMQRMPRVEAKAGSEMRVEGEEEPQTFGRQNFRFTFPYARQVDQYLPMILAVIGIFVAGFVIVENDTSQRAWMIILRFLVVFLAYTFVACPLALVGLGIGIFVSPNNSALMGAAPRNRQGIASGVLATARNVGMVLGVGFAGAIFTTVLGRAASPSTGLTAGVRASLLTAAGMAMLGSLTSAIRGEVRSPSA